MNIETAWVKPPPQVGGLDHLAVQAPCINVYGRLLPGITNVTDRARYYSFYPWLIWAFEQSGFTTYDDDFVECFRRADCLFTLIAERHAVVAGSDYEDHAGGMVGGNTLAAAARELAHGGSITLSDYSLREGAKARYFKNKLGGLGQYYLGVLRELSIVGGDAATGVKYSREAGQLLAKCVDAGFDGKLFLSAVQADAVTSAELEALSPLCPCRMAQNTGEQKLLADLFFARDRFYDIEALPRRRSLQSILQLSGLLYELDLELSESAFRACSYAGSLPNGDLWPIPEALSGNRQKWAVYARNEYLSVSIQGLFYAVLDAYEESGLRFAHSAQVVDWFVGQPEALDALAQLDATKTFSECLTASHEWSPEVASWADPAHEAQLVENIVRLSRGAKGPQTRRDIVTSSLRALIALARRATDDSNPYGELIFDEGYFRYYPINLGSFGYHRSNTWTSLPMRDVLRWLLLNWGIDVHLRVALRKLRGQSQSTFRIRPSDRGLEVIAVPPAVHTRPRFNQALRVLKDIGALEKAESGLWRPSSLGATMMEIGDAP